MAKKSGLGTSFDDLFDDGIFDSEDSAAPQRLKLTEIEPNKNQPRRSFSEEGINALAQSIAEHGVIEPLIVRPYGDSYQIVAGERRWRAAQRAGLKDVPVRIMKLSDEQTMQIALIENLQREDLDPIEEALGYQQLIDKFGMRQEEVAGKVGKARSSVTNSLRLLTLPDDIKLLVKQGQLSVGHCKVLIGIPEEQRQRELAARVVKDGISVRSLERLAKQTGGTKAPREKPPKATFIVEAEISMTDFIGKPVRIDKSKDRYTLSIDCANEEELKELIKTLSK